MNKLIKMFALIFIHAGTLLTSVAVGLAVTSPFVCIVYSVLDILCLGYYVTGKFLLLWLLVSCIMAVPLFITVEYRSHRARK